MTNIIIASPEIADLFPFVTIAIPTHNRAAWLRSCVTSALGQSYEHFEVVVSDNASTDETSEVLKQFNDQRLRVIRQASNIGPNRNWNACLAAARGNYVVFVSDDDTIAPHFLERCGALVTREPQIAVVVAMGDVVTLADGYRRPAIVSRKLATGVWKGTEILLEFLNSRISPQMCTVMIKTEALRSRGGFPNDWPHTGDLVSWVPLLLLGKAGLVNESCGTYCTHQATQTSRFSIDIILTDIARLVDLIIATAEREVSDARMLEEVKSQARRYVARHVIGHIAMQRKQGARLIDVLPVIGRWRAHLRYVGLGDIVGMTRSLALILLPGPITHWVRGFVRIHRQHGSRVRR